MRLRWQQGKQGTGYEKLLIFATALIPFDLYLLRYKEGAGIPWHKDPTPGFKHHRLNFSFGKYEGGYMNHIINNRTDPSRHYWRMTRRLYYFRPDLVEHCVQPVIAGTRYVLSLGWCT